MPLENEGNPEGLQLLRESLRKVQLESPDKVRSPDRQTDRQTSGESLKNVNKIQPDGQTYLRTDIQRDT